MWEQQLNATVIPRSREQGEEKLGIIEDHHVLTRIRDYQRLTCLIRRRPPCCTITDSNGSVEDTARTRGRQNARVEWGRMQHMACFCSQQTAHTVCRTYTRAGRRAGLLTCSFKQDVLRAVCDSVFAYNTPFSTPMQRPGNAIDYEDGCFVGYRTTQLGTYWLTFQGNLPPPLSGW
jgi:hypothetical protein